MANTRNKLKLDIACGKNTKQGFKGVDIWDGAEIVADLERFPWPFKDNSVDEIFCSHYIEHTPDLISFANELYRIMKVGAKAEIIAPYYSSMRAWQDPTHLRAISENTFLYFNKGWRAINKLDHYPITADFDFEYEYFLDQAWQGKKDDEVRFAIKHYINVVSDIRAVLTKREPCCDEAETVSIQASECWEEGRLEEAVGFCNQLVERGKAGLDEYLMLADYAFKNNEFKTAAERYRKALEDDGESFQAHVGLVRSLNVTGQAAKARTHLKGIKKSNPDLADLIQNVLGTIGN
jgi:tetratricopeptide (TPR) repeat protein